MSFRSRWFKITAWSLFWLTTLAGTAKEVKWIATGTPPGTMHDFVTPYSGARCLLLGCDPYNPAQVQQTFAEAGGQSNDHVEWEYTPPVYPPSTLVELVPFALLRYHPARMLWFLVSTVVFVASFLLWAGLVIPAYRPWMALLGALLRISKDTAFATDAGQASFIATGLAAIALWCFIRGRYTFAGIIALGIGMGLKPQLAGIVFLYLILRPVFRAQALKAAVIAIALLLAGAAWLGLSTPAKHWRAELKEQIGMSQQPGAINDPSPANPYSEELVNAQAAWALVTPNPATSNALSYLLFAVLLIPFVMRTWRGTGTNTGMFCALGAIACIGMLPVYHRVYDLLILFIAFPSLIGFFVQRQKFRWIAAGAMCVALIPGPIINRVPPIHALDLAVHLQCLAVIVLAITYLVAMYFSDQECDALNARVVGA